MTDSSADIDGKRLDHRLELTFPVRFVLKDMSSPIFEGEAVDFHSRGICVRSERSVPQGSLVDLHLFLPKQEKSLRTIAKVKWTQRLPGISKTVRMGMFFPRELDVALPISCLQENFHHLLKFKEKRWHLFRQERDLVEETSDVLEEGKAVAEKVTQRTISDRARPQLLFIDDDENLTTNLTELLKNVDYEVTVASSGESALEILKHSSFHVVLLDLQLPQMSGLEVLRVVKEFYPCTEVVIWTDFQTGRNAIDCLNFGAFHYFIKPVPFPVLREVLEKAIDRNFHFTTLEEIKSCYDALMNICSNGIGVLSPEGVFLDCNSQLCLLLGYCKEDLLGSSIFAVASDATRGKIHPLRQHVFKNEGSPFALTQQFQTKNGAVVPLRFSGEWVIDENGRPASAVVQMEPI